MSKFSLPLKIPQPDINRFLSRHVESNHNVDPLCSWHDGVSDRYSSIYPEHWPGGRMANVYGCHHYDIQSAGIGFRRMERLTVQPIYGSMVVSYF